MSEQPNGHVVIGDAKEIPLTQSQLLMLVQLQSQAQAAGEAADAVMAVARIKQDALQQALQMILAVRGIDDTGYHSMLDRSASVLKLVPTG